MANSRGGDPVTRLPAARRRCPICGKPPAAPHQPFCSSRCANIDLGRWLKESYRVPTEDPPGDAPEEGEG